MNKKMRELLAKKAQLISNAETAISAGKLDEAKTIRDEVKAVVAEIEVLSDLMAAEGMAVPTDPADAMKQKAEDAAIEDKSTKIRAANEYHRAFFDALKNGETIRSARGKEPYGILYDAMSETGGSPAGSEGGFLLPVDFDNMIHELRRDFSPMADAFNTENVTATSGWRVFEKAATMAAFASMTELTSIGAESGPEFVKVSYAITDYGGILPVANDLLDDTSVALMQYLARWMARKSVVTENSLLKAMIMAKFTTPSEYDYTKGISPLKKILNVTLDPVISAGATVITNQDGFDLLDSLNDAQGRPLLQPDPTGATPGKLIGRPVKVYANSVWASRVDASDSNHRKAPLFIGNGKEFGTLFRRKAFEMAATNVGAGAFESNSTKVRGIIRLDKQVTDGSAATLVEFDLGV